jgi:hypothetical protein
LLSWQAARLNHAALLSLKIIAEIGAPRVLRAVRLFPYLGSVSLVSSCCSLATSRTRGRPGGCDRDSQAHAPIRLPDSEPHWARSHSVCERFASCGFGGGSDTRSICLGRLSVCAAPRGRKSLGELECRVSTIKITPRRSAVDAGTRQGSLASQLRLGASK